MSTEQRERTPDEKLVVSILIDTGIYRYGTGIGKHPYTSPSEEAVSRLAQAIKDARKEVYEEIAADAERGGFDGVASTLCSRAKEVGGE